MKTSVKHFLFLLAMIGSSGVLTDGAKGDPLPGRDLLKFSQEPMIATQIQNTTGQTNTYFGHDELSTAYGYGTSGQLGTDYQGRFMADDFADKFTRPVVHLSWWGSYMDNNNAAVPPQAPVQRFLVAFEQDLPVGHPNNPYPYSIPGPVLQWDVLTLTTGPLTPGSGQFTEKLVPRPPGDPLNEPLYQYNGELHFNRNFPEQADTVYWLKITALVDLPAGTPVPPPPAINATKWGWHNRDYTIPNLLASTAPAVVPGESQVGTVDTAPVYHFQDDSVQGNLRFQPFNTNPNLRVFQEVGSFRDQNYVSFNSAGIGPLDGPASTPGTVGIDAFSKDLAFRLYATQIIPEPAACMLLGIGLAGVFATRRRSRTA